MKRIIVLTVMMVLAIEAFANQRDKYRPMTDYIHASSVLGRYYTDFIQHHKEVLVHSERSAFGLFCQTLANSDLVADRLNEAGLSLTEFKAILGELALHPALSG